MRELDNLGKIVTRRTYMRRDHGFIENTRQAAERTIAGNVKGKNVPESEQKELLRLAMENKAGPAGRGWWFSGSPAHARIGGAALNNCWYFNGSDWNNLVIAQDLLMLGGGVGLSVEHKFVSKLPKIKRGVVIEHKATKDADFIVPDSREGWCELLRRVLEAYFVTGRGFTYSTVCVRGYGEPIVGFGGVASGPIDLIKLMVNIGKILGPREGKAARPIDVGDLLCAIGEMVVAGNVRRSAIILIGDGHDREYLQAKRWDLGPLPSYRGKANFSVVCDDIEDLHPLFWKTYEHGEPFGIVNRTNMRKYGRMGELKEDTAEGMNPCVPAGTEILTEDGYIAIEKLVGKQVIVWNGVEWSAVAPRITGYNQRLVRVTLSSGQSLLCTPKHEFVTAIGYTGKTAKVEAQHLAPGVPLAKFDMPIVQGTSILNHAYTQGFISAEGMDDYNYFYVYGPKLMCLPKMSAINGDYDLSQKRMRCRPVFTPLPKSYVPVHDIDVVGRLEWLSGLLDGDGTVLKEGGVQIASVDNKFLLRVQKMLTTLGVTSKVSLCREYCDRMMPEGRGGQALFPCQDLYRMCIGSNEVQDLLSLGLSCLRLKLEGFTPQRNAGRFVTVESVEDAGFAHKVYCFTDPKNGTGCFEGIVTGQCAEATLENGEPCNLTEMALMNMDSEEEFIAASRLMQRWAKRVTMEHYHHPLSAEVVARNRRTGNGITGVLASPLFVPDTLDRAYEAIQDEDRKYSAQLGIPVSKRTTVVKPSGTRSKAMGCLGYEGIHAPLSRHMIQRVRFSAADQAIPLLKAAGHTVQPDIRFGDNTLDHGTLVVDFYQKAPDGFPVVDEGFDTWKQLDVLKMAQKHWADQAVSVTVYYKKEEIPAIKAWLAENLQYLKSISFLMESGHGFKLAPKEAITEAEYVKYSSKVKPIDFEALGDGGDLSDLECEGGVCPVK